MNPTNPTGPNQNNEPMQGLISPAQKQQLAGAPNLVGLPVDQQQQKINEMAQTVLKRVFSRIVNVLVDQDMQVIRELDKTDQSGNVVKYFLMTKVPNLELIIAEEIELLKKEVQTNQPPH